MRRAAILALCAACGHTEPADLAVVQRGELVIAVDVAGELAATDTAEVKPPTLRETSLFKITWLADDGTNVAVGAPLAKLDATDVNRSLESMRSDAAELDQRLAKRREEIALARREDALRVQGAEASARKAELKTQAPPELVASLDQRSQKLDEELARMSLEQTKESAAYSASSDAADLADLVEARAAVQRRIADATRSLDQLTVVAPRAGTIVYPVSQTEKRKIDDSVYQSDTILQVVGLTSMIGDAEVDEVDVGRIAPGNAIALRLDAFPDLQLRGTLDQITTEVHPRSTSDHSKVVRVKLALGPVHGAGLRPGMRFRGQIELARIADATLVSPDSVFVDGDQPIAYRETSHGLERVPLELGRRSTEAIEVRSGLVPGDRISKVAP